MFTGIVQAVGKIVSAKPFVVDAGKLSLRDVKVGDSICVQGCCLTVTRKKGRRCWKAVGLPIGWRTACIRFR